MATFALATGAFLLILCVIAYDMRKPFMTVNLMLLASHEKLLAEVAKSLTQLFYYHQGI